MVINFSKLMRLRVLSMQVSGPVGTIERAIVDPNTLKIIAFKLSGPTLGTADVGDILDVASIREISQFGIIIDSTDDLVAAGDVVRIDKVMELNFDLVGLKVITRKKMKLGKIVDWTMAENLELLQMIVQRPPIKAIMDPELVIDRDEITEVTDYEVIVKDEEKTLKEKATKNSNFVPNFVNPFREPEFAKARSHNPDE